MRKLLLIILACMIAGCGGDDKPKPPIKRAKTLIGYGNPWTWWLDDPKVFSNYLYSAGLNFTVIECDFNRDANFIANWVAPFRAKGITVEIVVVNWNIEESRYRPTAEYKKYFDDIVKALKTTDHIIMLPVSEPMNQGESSERKKCEEWMRYGYAHWNGNEAINDRFPIAKDNKNLANYHEEHWCKEFNESNIWKGANKLNNTDCGTLINSSPDKVYRMTKTAIKANANFCFYHAISDKHPIQFSRAHIDAMRRAIQES